MKRSAVVAAVAFTPYVAMIAGLPWFSGDGRIWFLPEIGFWILLWVALTPVFLGVADRIRRPGAAETEQEQR
ncbi:MULTISPECIES: hypothetical protein [Amycolatopsis]|uniref:DUF3311 domain-containing protein n=1 Tax=Amycolatopsis dendrobii TaxID=2760662 RepID=A0A7W3ZES0_9PSEU|nr:MULTISPECIES: hypothetical protein [Amycolatopsis]MBB1158234.1 hypothetical protein [Amycolatopsis dendrobii]MCG3755041.1 hypothetical protein [Amycolatopsis sp. Poz14]UKD56738.1 hypothetical protein L3Q65_08465 [Amycolatopsis sp. FU40]